MFIASKRNIIIPAGGNTYYHIPKDYIGEVPEWVAQTSYFAELVRDGKIEAPDSKQDAAIDDAMKRPVVDRKRDKKPAQA